MKVTAREVIQRPSHILAAAARGETITVIENGKAVARLVPLSNEDVPPDPTGHMSAVPLTDLSLPDLTDEKLAVVLRSAPGAGSPAPTGPSSRPPAPGPR